MFKLGLCSVTFREKSADEIIEICRKFDLKGIEWGGDIHLKPDKHTGYAEELKTRCAEAGVESPSYGSYFDVLEQPPEEFEPVLATAQAIGCDTIRVWPGWVRPENISEYQLEWVAQTSRRIAEMAEARKIRVGFEFHDETPTEGADATLRLLERVNHHNLFSYYQPIRPDDTRWNLENLERIYGRLAYIHVQANDGENNFPLEQYKELWQGIISRLMARSYDGWLFFEFNTDNSIEQLELDLALIRSFG
jgi:sugar phosphate isomerase/epimerase